MAFTDDAVKAKLSALNESQDSIVSVAQWIMFYRRHADRTAQMWLEKLKESNTSKKLNLIYLANEIMQQAKVRKKDDFLLAFMPNMAEATAAAYKGATQEVQQKIRRVVEVWRGRSILDVGIQDATEARIDELDKSRSSRSTGGRLGGSLFGSSSVPPELQPLAQQHAALSKVETTARPLVNKANTEYAEQTNPATPVPSAPVQAGRLSSLMKSLASAESAVNDSIKARKELIGGLEKLLASHKGKLTEEETTTMDLTTRRTDIEVKRKEVEDIIFRRVTAEDSPNTRLPSQNGFSEDAEGAERNGAGSPEVEGFTPPPPDVEHFTPNESPNMAPQPGTTAAEQGPDFLESDTFAADAMLEQETNRDEPSPAFEPPPALDHEYTPATSNSTAPALDILSSLALPGVKRASGSPPSNGAAIDPRKRRKMSHKAAEMDDQLFAMGDGVGLDDDVAAQMGAQ